MVTNRDRKSFWLRRMYSKIAQKTGTFDVFDPPSGIAGPTLRRASACPKSSWMLNPTRLREMPSCSAIDLAKIRRSYKISSWIWSIISGMFTLLGRPGRGATQVEKSPRLNWATQFLRWHTMVQFLLMFQSEWREYHSAACLARKKTWWKFASRCCWNRARHLSWFLSASVTRKDFKFGTWTDPSFQRHYRFRPTTSGSRSG